MNADEIIDNYLSLKGYSSAEQWALECGYWYNDDDDYWFDEDGPFDLEVHLLSYALRFDN